MFCNILKYVLLIEYNFNIQKGSPLGREWSTPCQRNKSKKCSTSFSITVFIKKFIKGRFFIKPPFFKSSTSCCRIGSPFPASKPSLFTVGWAYHVANAIQVRYGNFMSKSSLTRAGFLSF